MKHQRTHTMGKKRGETHGNSAAVRGCHQVDPVQVMSIHPEAQPSRGCLEAAIEPVNALRPSDAERIDCIHPGRSGEQAHGRLPARGGSKQSMNQNQQRSEAGDQRVHPVPFDKGIFFAYFDILDAEMPEAGELSCTRACRSRCAIRIALYSNFSHA